MADTSADRMRARRAAIEEDLRRRLEVDGHGPLDAPLRVLRCEACGETSSLDARFCTHCGVKFNATVMHAAGDARGRGRA